MSTTEDVLIQTRKLRRSIDRYLLSRGSVSATVDLLGQPLTEPVSAVEDVEAQSKTNPHSLEVDDLLRAANLWVKTLSDCDEPARTEIQNLIGVWLPRIRGLRQSPGTTDVDGLNELAQATDKINIYLRSQAAASDSAAT
jgi:hypothetical protein